MAYFPNGSSSEVLDVQCADCPLGAGWNDPNQKRLFDDDQPMKPCPVAFVQLTYNYDQLDGGNRQLRECLTLLIAEDGTCQTRELLKQCREEDPASVGD